MSFPSAAIILREQGIDPTKCTDERAARAALLSAMQTDTPKGFVYMQAFTEAVKRFSADAPLEEILAFIRKRQNCADCASRILRATRTLRGALKVDIDPNSTLGAQVMRLLGTDVARSVLEEYFDLSFALANCCGSIGAGKGKGKVEFTAAEQVAWQLSVDC